MKFYPEHIVQKARKLRKEGFSGVEIGRRLNIPDTTILRWCHDIPSKNPSYHFHVHRLQSEAQQRSVGLVKKVKLNRETAKIMASILYWCEGAKYPSSNFISFANSDVELVKTFLELFRLGFEPKENKIKAYLQLHTTHNVKEMTAFWVKLLQIPESRFYKPTITKPTKNMKRRDYKGTCTVRYCDVYLLHEMMGIYGAFFKEINHKN